MYIKAKLHSITWAVLLVPSVILVNAVTLYLCASKLMNQFSSNIQVKIMFFIVFKLEQIFHTFIPVCTFLRTYNYMYINQEFYDHKMYSQTTTQKPFFSNSSKYLFFKSNEELNDNANQLEKVGCFKYCKKIMC